MQVDLYTTAGALASLSAEWEDLLQRSSYDTLFMRSEWLRAWWEVFGSQGTLRLLTVRDNGGRLLGLAPLFLAEIAADPAETLPPVSYERPIANPAATTQRALLLVGGTEVSDYADFVVDRTQAPAVYAAIFDALEAQVPGWEWLDLHNLPEGSPTPAMLGDLARARGLTVELGQEDVCPFVPLPKSWQAYLGALGKKQRHELRRKMRNVERAAPVRLLVASNAAELASHMQAFMALHEASTPDKADFMRDPRMRRFFHLVSQTALAGGWLDLSFLALDGELAAGLLCFRYQGSLMVYNSGYQPEAWPGLSPGIALLGLRIKRAIEDGLHEVDFLQGSERYKYDFGAQDRAVQRLLIRQP